MPENDTSTTEIDATPASEAASTPETPRRAPRKRAAKKAAPAAAPELGAAEPAVEAAAEPTGAEAPPAAEPAPPVRATRSRARKAAAPTLAAPDPVAEQAPVEQPGSAAAEAVVATPAADAAPAAPTRAPRKRAAKKAAPAADVPTTDVPTPEVPAAAVTEPVAVVVEAPAAAIEPEAQAPAEPAAKPARAPRRRRAAAPAVEVETAEPTLAVEQIVEPVLDAAVTEAIVAAELVEDLDEQDEELIEDAEIEAQVAALLPDVEADAEIDAAAEADADEADGEAGSSSRRRRRGRRGRGSRTGRDSDGADASDAGDSPDAGDAGAEPAIDHDEVAEVIAEADGEDDDDSDGAESDGSGTRRRRKRRRRGGSGGPAGSAPTGEDDPSETVVHVRESRDANDEVRGIRGSTRLEAKRQRRRDNRDTSRRRAPILTESEFLARRESVDRVMAVRQRGDRTQIAVLEDGILVEHYVTRASSTSYVGNIYLGRVQNVLPSMEAAFIDIGKGRNGVLYAGEVDWDAAGLAGRSRAIEQAMSAGDSVLVQVTKDPIGHKGARLTSQISLPGRFLVYVPGGGMTGISRKLPDTERARLKAILKKIVPEDAGVIIRTAAEGASEDELTRDVERLQEMWETVKAAAAKPSSAPVLLHGEPDLAIRVVRDVFNEDFAKLVVSGDDAWTTVSDYVTTVAPELSDRISRYTGTGDLFHDLRVDEQLAKALDRKVWLPSGGSLVIDRTEAMVVIDVNTGKFTGSGGNLEQTVTRNNLEAAEEIVRQLRLRDVGGIVVIDFIDMVLESNRDLVLRRLTECLGRDRTKHQVAEVTSLGLVQMTRKRVGEGLLEAFSEPCEVCHGRGVIVHAEPVFRHNHDAADGGGDGGPRESKSSKRRNRRGNSEAAPEPVREEAVPVEQRRKAASVMNAIAGALPDAAPAETNHAGSTQAGSAHADSVQPGAGVGGPSTNDGPAVEPDRSNGWASVFSAAPSNGHAIGNGSAEPRQASEPPADGGADGATEPVAASPSRSSRRRRAASRPAGPPVHA